MQKMENDRTCYGCSRFMTCHKAHSVLLRDTADLDRLDALGEECSSFEVKKG